MKNYAVSIVWTKQKSASIITIGSSLSDIEANSKEEAFGKVYENNKDKYSDFKMEFHTVIELKQEDSE